MIAGKKRDKLSKNIPNNTLIVLVGKSEQIRNGDVAYPFRQDSDVLLLTGANIPDLILLGVKRDDEMKWALYSDELTDREKLWGSTRISREELSALTGIGDIRDKRKYIKDVKTELQTIENIFVKKGGTTDQKRQIQKLHLSGVKEKLRPLEPLLVPLRMIKMPEEIEKIRKAISITHEAYDKIRANIKPQMYEYEIEAIIAGIFRRHHATEAYPTIVASGPHACTLHYERHTRMIEPGDIVLIDFGAEYEGYAADITRVFQVPPFEEPVPDLIREGKSAGQGGLVSEEPPCQVGKSEAKGGLVSRKIQIYNSVLAVKNYAESLIKPGVKKSEYERMVRERMNEELVKLLLLPPFEGGIQGGSSPEQNPQSPHTSSTAPFKKELIETLSRKYYPHSTSHFLGLDVHDTGERDQIFEAGMVITCEPGIYITEEGIGIRLEDDILITESGCENLSKNICIRI